MALVFDGVPTAHPPKSFPARPLVIGRGPWAKNIWRTLDELKVPYTVSGRITAQEDVMHAQARGNTHVIIATPLSTHYDLAKMALRRSIPTFLEKPACSTLTELVHLHRLAQDGYGRTITKFLVNSIHLFSEGAEKMVEEWNGRHKHPYPPSAHGTFGGPGPVREDCNGLWDYGWHPLSLMWAVGIPLDGWVGSTNVALGTALVEPGMWAADWLDAEGNPKYGVVTSTRWEKKRTQFSVDGWELTRVDDQLVWIEAKRMASQARHYWCMEQPPLTRALSLFLSDEHDWRNDQRFGFELPLAVTRCLESLCPSVGDLKK